MKTFPEINALSETDLCAALMLAFLNLSSLTPEARAETFERIMHMLDRLRRLTAVAMRRARLPHEAVPYGLCNFCGHYGEDCTGRKPQ